MAKEMQPSSMYLEQVDVEGYENGGVRKNVDDDGRPKRTGTWLTASAHIITAVIGSGVLSLAWAIAQLGWVAGPVILMAFSFITFFTSTLLADSYRSPDPVTGKRNYTYMDAVRANLGGWKVTFCGISQYANLVGITVGYTITASISMVAVKRSNCFHRHGHAAKCHTSNNPYMIIFACIQIILSQIPNFHKLSWLSVLAAVMSFAYSSIGLGLSIAKVAGGEHVRTSITGTTVGVDVTAAQKIWRAFQSIGDIAFAYAYSTVLIEIQDTIKSGPPENKAMKKASFVGIVTTTMFYILCGCIGYAAFGNDAPGNFLTGFGFYEPFWLIDIANVCIAIHLIGAYQVFCQPIFSFMEKNSRQRWPENKFITTEYAINIPFLGVYYLSTFRLVWRTLYVIVTAIVAMILPFFNDFLGLIGAAAFWPLTVYFPIEMYITRTRIPKFSSTWIWLKILTLACLVVSLLAAAGSVEGLINSLKTYKPFQSEQ
ncbi:amino acid transporter, putative [Ricinus communis]|uniref:Amino acid transporter, putative n=1 Tax=Ricinus communis TaxID=3988 RepID=B9R6S0_RICCO|nr:amino acid transporter, putative [Ricinus communis]|eukprot:XP_002510013.1 amino acid permease 6 [Ricinus communis]